MEEYPQCFWIFDIPCSVSWNIEIWSKSKGDLHRLDMMPIVDNESDDSDSGIFRVSTLHLWSKREQFDDMVPMCVCDRVCLDVRYVFGRILWYTFYVSYPMVRSWFWKPWIKECYIPISPCKYVPQGVTKSFMINRVTIYATWLVCFVEIRCLHPYPSWRTFFNHLSPFCLESFEDIASFTFLLSIFRDGHNQSNSL